MAINLEFIEIEVRTSKKVRLIGQKTFTKAKFIFIMV